MEQKKDYTLKQIAENSRNAVAYIEALHNNILTLHWRIHKLFTRSRSATYTKLHRLFSRIHDDSPKDAQKVGVAGNGFFIDPDTLVTNIHVVANANTIAAKQLKVKRTPLYLPDHKDFPYGYKKTVSKDPVIYTIVGVKAFDAKNDLVFLKVAEKCDTPLCIGNSESVTVGDQVYTLSYRNADYRCVEGIISGRDKRRRFEVKTQYFPGDSGSPLLNSSGEVIGIACSIRQPLADHSTTVTLELGDAIQSDVLSSLLEETEEIVTLDAWQKLPSIRAYAIKIQADRKYAQGKNTSALSKLNRVLKLNPDILEAYINRGGVKSSLGNYVEAIEDYDKAVQLSPSNTAAYYNRGRAKSRLGESNADQEFLVEARHHYQTAIDDFNEAIKQDPQRSIAYNNRGWTHYLTGKVETKEGNKKEAKILFQRAITDVNEALRLQPTGDHYRSAYYHTRGAVMAALDDHESAIQDFDESINFNPKKAVSYHDRGLSKETLGLHEAAKVDFQKAKELDPKIKK